MGGAGGFVKNLTAEYMPAYGAQTLHVKVTTAANTVQRLGALNPTPQIPDDTHSANNAPQRFRPPWHLIIQNPSYNAIPIYITWDNNTAPAAGGPGLEINPGGYAKFEHAEALLTPHAVDTYQVNSLSAIQVIALNAVPILLTYSD